LYAGPLEVSTAGGSLFPTMRCLRSFRSGNIRLAIFAVLAKSPRCQT
jgi:hypothetical protein